MRRDSAYNIPIVLVMIALPPMTSIWSFSSHNAFGLLENTTATKETKYSQCAQKLNFYLLYAIMVQNY